MSKYFQTLRRLQEGTAKEAAGSAPDHGVESLRLTRPVALSEYGLQSTEAKAALSGLLDGLRLAVKSAPSRAVVIADVSGSGAASRLMAGLEMTAVARRVSLVVGELATMEGSRFLNLYPVPRQEDRPEGDSPTWSPGQPGSLDLREDSLSEVLEPRIDEVDARAEIAVIQGPALAESVDAALVASATGGIVLVVEPQVTLGSDLSLAISRTERAGGEILGVVTVGAGSSLPKWLRRALSGVSG